MKKISLGKLVGGLLGAKDAPGPWRPHDVPYPRLLEVDAESLKGRQGVYAVWHLGVRPQWLRVGAADDLGAALGGLAHAAWIVRHQDNAGVYVAWADVPPEQQGGVVRFLTETLKPAFQHEVYAGDRAADPAATVIAFTLPPGTGK
jgi:hypothetical protein